MNKRDKLLNRLLSKSKDFTYSELTSLLESYGYSESKRGKTGGSRRSFINKTTKHIIRLHKPHPKEVLKTYQINQIITELKSEGYT